jgi:hypothetical protein
MKTAAAFEVVAEIALKAAQDREERLVLVDALAALSIECSLPAWARELEQASDSLRAADDAGELALISIAPMRAPAPERRRRLTRRLARPTRRTY